MHYGSGGGGGGGTGYRRRDEWRPRGGRYHRGGGGGYRGGGGGGYRGGGRRRDDRGNRPHKRQRASGGEERPAVVQLGQSAQMVQLLVRVADVDARRTIDAESRLLDNLRNLAGAVEAEARDNEDRTADLLLVVARSSPLGIKPLGVLGALMARQNANFGLALARVISKNLTEAAENRRQFDFKATCRFWCELAVREILQPPTQLLETLSSFLDETTAPILVSCCLILASFSQFDQLRQGIVSALGTWAKNSSDSILCDGIEAIATDPSMPNIDNLEGWDDDWAEGEERGEPASVDFDASALNLAETPFFSGKPLPILPGAEELSALTATERFYLRSLAVDTCAAFRPGSRWDGVVVGDKAQLAKQLLGMSQLLREPSAETHLDELTAGVLLSLVCAGSPGYDGVVSGKGGAAHGDAGIDSLHVAIELCRESPSSFAPKLAARIELVFRDMDDVDYRHSARLAQWFALFLNNTKFVWPYWGYWAQALDDIPEYDPQRRFVVALFDYVVRLSYNDRLKCAPDFPESLHQYLPKDDAKPIIDDEKTGILYESDSKALADALDKLDDDEDEADDQEKHGVSDDALVTALKELHDDAARCLAVTHAALQTGSASVSHTLSALDRLAEPLAAVARGEDDCEAACLDAVLAVWANSTFYFTLCSDGLLRRGVLRPRALAVWILDDNNQSRWAASKFAESCAPLELIDIAVDRSLDLVAAGVKTGDEDILNAQLDEANEVALEIFATLINKLDAIARRAKVGEEEDEDDDDSDQLWSKAAISVLADLASRYERSKKANLETTRRSSPALALPKKLFDASHIKATVLHDGIHSTVVEQVVAACFDS